MQQMSCISLYRLAITDLISSIQQSVSDGQTPTTTGQTQQQEHDQQEEHDQQTIAIFQTTTAG